MKTFQIIDTKKECTGLFIDGAIEHRDIANDLSGTWSYHPNLIDSDIEIASLYCGGQSLDDVCPDVLKDRWEVRKKKIKSFVKSFYTAKVNLDDVCFYDLVPNRHLYHYYELKNEITEHVLTNYDRPKNYSLLLDTTETIEQIAQQEVRLNWGYLKRKYSTDLKAKSICDRFYGTKPTVVYDLFGSKTGRLSTKSGSFPILNYKKELRAGIEPKWDCFVELDYNAAEVRTLLSLSGEQQPKGDIHEWNAKNIFGGETTRDEAKRKFLAWLYNPNSERVRSSYYDRNEVLKQFFDGSRVKTPFNREIDSDGFHALNYLLQSSSSDNFLRQANKINRFLRNKKTNVAFLIHDSIILDMPFEERDLVGPIMEIFEETTLGTFPSNLSLGRNLGNMVRL